MLFVDDDELMQDLMAVKLKNLKELYLDLSLDGNDALGKIETNQYDLIISDICMPNMTGIELCKIVKQGDENIKFALFSGKISLTPTEIIETKADYFINKDSTNFHNIISIIENLFLKKFLYNEAA